MLLILNREFRAEIKKVERHWKSNLIIRLYIFTFSLISGLVFYFESIGFLWFVYAAIVPSVIWTALVIIFRLCRAKPIHPAVHVGLELTL